MSKTFEQRSAEWMLEIFAALVGHLREGGYDHSDANYFPNNSLFTVYEKISEAAESLGIEVPEEVQRCMEERRRRVG